MDSNNHLLLLHRIRSCLSVRLVYEQPEFVDKASGVRSLSDILQIAITVLIFALLGFVVFKSTRSSEEEPKEEELSVDSLLEQTAENNEPLEDIGYNEKRLRSCCVTGLMRIGSSYI